MRATRDILTAIAALFVGLGAYAADNNLLIQLGPDGRYRVWHAEGVTHLTEDEVLSLAANAKPEGSDPVRVSIGTARAFQTEQGVVIEIADATTDGKLLVDRDECGAIKTWHSDGATKLTDDEVTELVISALPAGGRRVKVGGNYAKAFIAPLGYPVVIWKPVVR